MRRNTICCTASSSSIVLLRLSRCLPMYSSTFSIQSHRSQMAPTRCTEDFRDWRCFRRAEDGGREGHYMQQAVKTGIGGGSGRIVCLLSDQVMGLSQCKTTKVSQSRSFWDIQFGCTEILGGDEVLRGGRCSDSSCRYNGTADEQARFSTYWPNRRQKVETGGWFTEAFKGCGNWRMRTDEWFFGQKIFTTNCLMWGWRCQ